MHVYVGVCVTKMSSVIYHRSIYGQFEVPLTLHLYTNKLQYIMYDSTNTQHIIGFGTINDVPGTQTVCVP